jgi:hypothetical protein
MFIVEYYFKILESIQNFLKGLDFSQYFPNQASDDDLIEICQSSNEPNHETYFPPDIDIQFLFADSKINAFKDLLLWFFPIPEKGISINLFNILACAFWITLGLTVIAFLASNPIMLIVCSTLTGLLTLAHLYSEKFSEIEFQLIQPK